ncbi:MAG: DUF5069 domain-containing protein [Candidatus Latescibacteria bacterium]|nr:DUF5069 domain-containing protein [Candidatus Latescibacterota bacterium]MBT5831597.1 DUF5069 domain-containing protein [Candidatus Latescibacterota bacterium]
MRYPISAYTKTGGIVFFARMLDKMRMLLKDELTQDYVVKMQVNNCYNSRCLQFLGVSYNDVLDKVAEGRTDQEILNWCFETGHRPNEEEIFVWNQFMIKKGWRDEESEQLANYKVSSGIADRDDIVTFFDYYDMDEGRRT